MKHGERITPISAALSALATILCCLPIGFAAAAATASLGVVVAALRPWLLGIAVVLLGLGFVQMYYGARACQRRSRTSLVILWVSAAVVALVLLFPQVIASAAADLLPSK